MKFKLPVVLFPVLFYLVHGNGKVFIISNICKRGQFKKFCKIVETRRKFNSYFQIDRVMELKLAELKTMKIQD